MLALMKMVLFAVMLQALIGVASAQTSVRQFDFKNFNYPWKHYSAWPYRLEWQDTAEPHHIQLVNGRWRDGEEEGEEKHRPFSGLTFEDVQFVDVTSDGRTDALVTLRYDTGGTQYSHYVYIYSFATGKPNLLAYFHSGDRAASGLYRVYGQHGRLVVELFDPEKRLGDCCSSGFIRTRYTWHDGKFDVFGGQESGKTKTPSRIPVNVFGMHESGAKAARPNPLL